MRWRPLLPTAWIPGAARPRCLASASDGLLGIGNHGRIVFGLGEFDQACCIGELVFEARARPTARCPGRADAHASVSGLPADCSRSTRLRRARSVHRGGGRIYPSQRCLLSRATACWTSSTARSVSGRMAHSFGLGGDIGSVRQFVKAGSVKTARAFANVGGRRTLRGGGGCTDDASVGRAGFAGRCTGLERFIDRIGIAVAGRLTGCMASVRTSSIPGAMRKGVGGTSASAPFMKSRKIGAATVAPCSNLPRVRGLSKPTNTPQSAGRARSRRTRRPWLRSTCLFLAGERLADGEDGGVRFRAARHPAASTRSGTPCADRSSLLAHVRQQRLGSVRYAGVCVVAAVADAFVMAPFGVAKTVLDAVDERGVDLLSAVYELRIAGHQPDQRRLVGAERALAI